MSEIIVGIALPLKLLRDHTRLAVVDVGYGDGILKSRAKHEALIKTLPYSRTNDEPYVC